MSLLIFPQESSHAIFAAAITTASAMSVSIRKPLAVTCLLFICFPVKMGLWIFLASIIAVQFSAGRKNQPEQPK